MNEAQSRKRAIALTLCILMNVIMASAEENENVSTDKLNTVVQICTGSLIAIESSLLLFGMNYPAATDWSSAKNISFAVSDILLGSFLIYGSVTGKEIPASLIFATYGLLLSTHVFRDIEPFTKYAENRFCHNTPLYVLNNIRIGLLTAGVGLSFTVRY